MKILMAFLCVHFAAQAGDLNVERVQEQARSVTAAQAALALLITAAADHGSALTFASDPDDCLRHPTSNPLYFTNPGSICVSYNPEAHIPLVLLWTENGVFSGTLKPEKDQSTTAQSFLKYLSGRSKKYHITFQMPCFYEMPVHRTKDCTEYHTMYVIQKLVDSAGNVHCLTGSPQITTIQTLIKK